LFVNVLVHGWTIPEISIEDEESEYEKNHLVSRIDQDTFFVDVDRYKASFVTHCIGYL
tara:strand:+ start:1076 stop:1249 length:174 start_codon:yes stop_codon:yes gene_type:complete